MKLSVIAFFTVLVVLVEVAVAKFIFSGPSPLVRDFSMIERIGFSNFAVVGGGASEATFVAL